MLPRLHLATDDAVLADPLFLARASAIVLEVGSAVAIHLRSRSASARTLYERALALRQLPGAIALINERVDVALAADVAGVQLPGGGLPVERARALLGPDRWIGRSVHTIAEAAEAGELGADFVVAGMIYASATHPERSPQGPEFLARLCLEAEVPVIAIGGVNAGQARECRQAGAYGVAVIRAVWHAPDPVVAVRALLEELNTES